MASSLDIKKVQMIHKIKQDGKMGPVTMTYIKQFQSKQGLKVTGLLDSATLAKYKQLWPYAWGGSSSSSSGSSSSSSVGQAADFGPMADKLIGGVLLYGIFRVLMKVF